MASLMISVLILVGIVFYFFNQSKKGFCRKLPSEIQLWLAEGIIQEADADKIRKRYRLDELEQESQTMLIKIIFGFGIVLIALGIVAFVTAHWESIPRFGRLGLVVGSMFISHLTGFWLWERKKSPVLGHALIVLGTLIFGASIALIAQIFHLPGDFYDGVLVWVVGALVMGYAVSSLPHFILALIGSCFWYFSWLENNPNKTWLMPLLIIAFVLVFIPYAFKKPSRIVHFLTMILSMNFYLSYLAFANNTLFDSETLLILGVTFMSLFFWGYGNWAIVKRREGFSGDARMLSVLGLGITGYILSFHRIVLGIVSGKPATFTFEHQLITVIVVAIISITNMGFFELKSKSKPRVALSDKIIMAICLILLAIPFIRGVWAMVMGTVLANLVVLILGIYLFYKGLIKVERREFWLGMLILVALVVGRFFEYETGLLLKSAAFVLAGLLLVIGGLYFEKRRGRKVMDVAT